MTIGKILVVDDDPEILKALSLLLSANGFEVVTAMDGFQATSIAMKEQPDVILLDISMPAGDGHVVVSRLKESSKTCPIPIIIITASAEESDYEKAVEQGVDGYFKKPFDPEELIRAIHELTP